MGEWDTPGPHFGSIETHVTGAGSGVDPYVVNADAVLSPQAGNVLTTDINGALLVPCASIQSCVSASDGTAALATCEPKQISAPLQPIPVVNNAGQIVAYAPARHHVLALFGNGSVVNPAYNDNTLCTSAITINNPSSCRVLSLSIGITVLSQWSAAATNAAIQIQLTTPGGGTFTGPDQEISAGGPTAFPAGVNCSVSWWIVNQSIAAGGSGSFIARAVLAATAGTPGNGTGNMTVQFHVEGKTL